MFRLLAASALAVFAGASISDCDSASVFRPTKLALNPDPPVRGQPVTMTVQFYNPDREFTDGRVVTSVSLNGIPFTPSEEPLCENTVCPIAVGANDRSAVSTWPDTVSGKVVTKSQWYGPGGESLLCVKTSVSVSATHKHKSLRGALWHIVEQLQEEAQEKSLIPWQPAALFNWTDVTNSTWN